MANHHEISNFIWQIADLLRGPYRPPQYERVMLPMTILRRFDCVLAPTKDKVLREHEKRKGGIQLQSSLVVNGRLGNPALRCPEEAQVGMGVGVARADGEGAFVMRRGILAWPCSPRMAPRLLCASA